MFPQSHLIFSKYWMSKLSLPLPLSCVDVPEDADCTHAASCICHDIRL